MNSLLKRCFAILIAAALVCQTGVFVWADNGQTSDPMQVKNVSVNDAVTWSLDAGILKVSGNGAMEDYETESSCPWDADRQSIVKVVIGDGITHIGAGSFCNCSNLKEIEIGSRVGSVGERAFSNTEPMKTVIPDSTFFGSYLLSAKESVEEVIVKSGRFIGCRAFEGCNKLKSITIPDTVICIEEGAFCGCSSLESVTIPNRVTSIENYAFEFCSSLTDIAIPDSVTVIGDSAFVGCSNLNDITLPSGIKSIGDYTFHDCTSLAEIVLPDSVKSIGNGAFYGCGSLTDITIPESLTEIGTEAFHGCSSLTDITIPDKVTAIGDYAFNGCSGLTAITVKDGITRINNGVFFGCKSLTGITIPDSVTVIGIDAFHGCSSLTGITFPDSVKSIMNFAFADCSKLTDITIPCSVGSIGDKSFIGCGNAVFHVVEDSYANRYANDHDLNYDTFDHKWENITRKATFAAAGSRSDRCSVCNYISPESTESIPKLAASLSHTAYTFYGTVRTPAVTVKSGAKILTKNNDYTVTYASGRKNVGTYKVTVKMKGNDYSGSNVLSFKINPKGTTLLTPVAASKAITVKWKKQATKMSTSVITGYQIQLATDSAFTKNKKQVTIKGYSNVSKKVTRLLGGKRYYIRIRTYKTVSGVNYYSAWSAKKYITTKK